MKQRIVVPFFVLLPGPRVCCSLGFLVSVILLGLVSGYSAATVSDMEDVESDEWANNVAVYCLANVSYYDILSSSSGNGGTVEIQTGVQVDVGTGEDGSVIGEDVEIGEEGADTEKHFRQVMPKYSLESLEESYQEAKLIITGNVVIYCQYLFHANIHLKPNAKLTVHAGQPTELDLKASAGKGGPPWNWTSHDISLTQSTLGGPGSFQFLTTHRGHIVASVEADGGHGGEALEGLREELPAGNGGHVVLNANESDVKLYEHYVSVQGGSSPVGKGGNGGTVFIRGANILFESDDFYAINAAGGLGGNGKNGDDLYEDSPETPRVWGMKGTDGGAGGNGGCVMFIGALPRNASERAFVHGGPGGLVGDGGYGGSEWTGPDGDCGGDGGNGGNGGAGGIAGNIIHEDTAGNQTIQQRGKDGRGGNGGAGGNGGSGRIGGNGGNGGNGGDSSSAPGAGGKFGSKGYGDPEDGSGDGKDGKKGNSGDTALRENTLVPPNQPELIPAKKAWTFMFYFGGDDKGMEKDILNEIDLLEQVPVYDAKNNTLNIVVQQDRYTPEATYKIPKDAAWGTWGNTRRAGVVPDQKNDVKNYLGNGCSTAFYPVDENSDSEYSTGEGCTLSTFITWAKETAPADNYALILFGHSAAGIFGCMGDLTDALATSVHDGKPIKDWLKINELQEALRGNNGKNTVEILVLDSCQMMSIETVAQLRQCCKYLIGSQARSFSNLINTSLFQYRAALEQLALANSTQTPEQVAQTFFNVNNNYTASVIDMNVGKIDRLLIHLKEYFDLWRSRGSVSCISTNWNRISLSQTRKKNVSSKELVDKEYTDLWWALASTRIACGDVDTELEHISDNVLKDLDSIMAYNKAFSSDYQGVSILFKHPDSRCNILMDYKRAPFDFLTETGYVDCLWPILGLKAAPGTGDSLSKALPLTVIPQEHNAFAVHMEAPLTESYFSVNAEAGMGIAVEAGGMGLSEHAKMSLTLYTPESKSILETVTGEETSLGGEAGGNVSSGVLTLPDTGTYGIKVGVLDNTAADATRFLLSLRLGDPESLYPRAEVTPSSCAFVGEVGYASQEFVEIRNTGLMPLTITEITVTENTPFETDTWSLAEGDRVYPGDSRQLGILFSPAEAGMYDGEVHITTDSSVTPSITIPVSGQASVGTCSLVVHLGPEAAVEAGAQWRRAGGAWSHSGMAVSGILAGTYEVEFIDVFGWLAPSALEVEVSGDTTIPDNNLTLYTAMKEGTGAIRVLPQPDTGIAPDDVKWRRVGTVPWMPIWGVENNVPAGSYDIEFTAIQGWKTPEPRFIRVTEGQTATLFLVYEPDSNETEGEGESPEGEFVEPQEGETPEGETVEPQEGEAPEGESIEPQEGEAPEGETVEPQEGEAPEGESVEPQEEEALEGETVEPQEGESQEGESEEGESPEGELDEGEPEEGETGEGKPSGEGEPEEGETGEGEPSGEGESLEMTITVPDVTGKSQEEAIQVLESLGFTVILREEDSKGPQNIVSRQDPVAGSEATKGSNVTLTLFKGQYKSFCGCGTGNDTNSNLTYDIIFALLFLVITTSFFKNDRNKAKKEK